MIGAILIVFGLWFASLAAGWVRWNLTVALRHPERNLGRSTGYDWMASQNVVETINGFGPARAGVLS